MVDNMQKSFKTQIDVLRGRHDLGAVHHVCGQPLSVSVVFFRVFPSHVALDVMAALHCPQCGLLGDLVPLNPEGSKHGESL